MLLTVYIKGRRIIVGELKNKIFKKTVKKSKHLFRKFDSWGFDYSILVNSIIPQSNLICVYDTEEKIYYYTTPNVFGKIEEGRFIPSPKVQIRRYKDKNTDHQAQIFLPRRYWMKSNDTMTLEKVKEKEILEREIKRYKKLEAQPSLI